MRGEAVGRSPLPLRIGSAFLVVKWNAVKLQPMVHQLEAQTTGHLDLQSLDFLVAEIR